MKIALCLSGHLRTYNYTYQSVFDQLINKYDVDVFISTWNNLGNQFAYHAHYKDGKDAEDPIVSATEIINIYKPVHIVMDDAKTEPVTAKIKQDYANLRTENGAQVSQIMCMLYKIWDCNRMKKEHAAKHNITYDITIRSRCDVFMKFFNMEAAQKAVQFMPGHMGLNDITFLGPTQMVDDVCDIYTVMTPEVPFNMFHNVEQMWLTHVQENEIPSQVGYDTFDYNRYTWQGVFDCRGKQIGNLP